MRLVDLARTRVRFGYRRLYELLRREGWKINHKRVHRLYVMAGLQLNIRRKVMLWKNLSRRATPDAIAAAYDSLGIARNARAEELSPDLLFALFSALRSE